MGLGMMEKKALKVRGDALIIDMGNKSNLAYDTIGSNLSFMIGTTGITNLTSFLQSTHAGCL